MKIKRFIPLTLFLLFLAMISGYLMSKASLAGRIGIGLFYKEYRFLKTWWQGALVVLAVLIILLALLAFLQSRIGAVLFRIVCLVMVLLAIIGFNFTWQDFHHTLTHRMLGGRFQLGAYLFWLGWAVISVFFILNKPGLLPNETKFRHTDVPQHP